MSWRPLRRVAATGAVLVATLVATLGAWASPAGNFPVPTLGVRVVATYPHDPTAFTEGLEMSGSTLYESVGLYGHSELRVVDMATGTVRRRAGLAGDQWAEGMTVVGARIWQLTYREHIAHIWDGHTLAHLGQATYTGEGWGLCANRTARLLVMSDGSDRLVLRDPDTFAERDSVRVVIPDFPGSIRLNELECVGEAVWAVLAPTSYLARIEIPTGRVTTLVNASGLLTAEEAAGARELNGIAAVRDDGTFLITGKFWPKVFRVRLDER